MKRVLLLGDEEGIDSSLSIALNSKKYKIIRVKSCAKALKFLKKISPDFVLCIGKIRKNGNGKYFVEI